MEIQEGEKGTEATFEAMTENFQILLLDTKTQIKELREHQAGQMPKTYTLAYHFEITEIQR